MMVNLQDNFDTFLVTITPGPTQRKRIDSAAEAISTFLAAQYDLSTDQVFQQGSYPNGTAVKPVEGGEYDVDLVCVCAAISDTADTALDTLAEVFKGSGNYKDRVVEKTPCVRLKYADDNIGKFHVDVVPAMSTGITSPPLLAPRRGDGWHGTAPADFTAWCQGMGDDFSRTVKALKRWRDEHQGVRDAIKSIVLQVLVAQNLGIAADDATRLDATFRSIDAYLSPLSSPPQVINPVLTGENLAERWTDQSFANFKSELRKAVGTLDRARAATDVSTAAETWREILGDDFPAPDVDDLGLRPGDTSHEQSYAHRGWIADYQPGVSIDVRVRRFRPGQHTKGSTYDESTDVVLAGHLLRFEATTTSAPLGQLWWQVTNTGEEARKATSLRGEFLEAKARSQMRSDNPSIHWERTAYTGVHRVRAILVRDNRVMGTSPYVTVNIVNRG